MLAVFRVDASERLGTGHVMRCLTLAEELSNHRFTCVFICKPLIGHMGDYIQERGFQVIWMEARTQLDDEDAERTVRMIESLQQRPRLLIVDHYELDANWETIVRPFAEKLIVIDDLANRRHEADLLIDQNLYENMEERYRRLVPEQCRLLLGPRYLLLKPRFYQERRGLRSRDGQISRLLLFFGGSDPTNETGKALQAIASMNPALSNVRVDVIIGLSNPFRSEVEDRCRNMEQATLYVQEENMAYRIATADFALGAGGISMWERCYLGLPSAITIVAENQRESVQFAAGRGAVWNLGWHAQVKREHYQECLSKALNSPSLMRSLASKSLEMTSGLNGETASNGAAAAMLAMLSSNK